MLEFLKIIILSVVEGITEFLPISSTAHLLFLSELMSFDSVPNKSFEIIIQLGAILPICVIYREKLFGSLLSAHKDSVSQRFCLNILIAFLPIMFVGYFFHDFIKQVLFSSNVFAVTLILGGVVLYFLDDFNLKVDCRDIDDVSKKSAFKIGLMQCLAVIPGVSRAGSTIVGGMLFGLDKKTAAEFSFFLALPTILAASALDLIKNYKYFSQEHFYILTIGFILSFIFSYLIVRFFLVFLSHRGLRLLGIYRIFLGLLIFFVV